MMKDLIKTLKQANNELAEGIKKSEQEAAEWFERFEKKENRNLMKGKIMEEQLTFGQAIEAAKQGHKIARAGWNGKNMWVVYMSGMKLPPYNTQDTARKVNDRTAKLVGEDTPLETLPYFAMWTADKKWLPGWLASQTDMLADDWMIVRDINTAN